MSRDLKGRITDAGELDWGGPISTHRAKELLKANPGRSFTLTVNDRESDRMRAYFHGAVKPWFFYIHPLSGWQSFKDAEYALKTLLNPVYSSTTTGEPVVLPGSLRVSSKRYGEFLERVQDWAIENGYGATFPNPEDFKLWRDTDFSNETVYPPLRALKETYEKVKRESAPAWRRSGNIR